MKRPEGFQALGLVKMNPRGVDKSPNQGVWMPMKRWGHFFLLSPEVFIQAIGWFPGLIDLLILFPLLMIRLCSFLGTLPFLSSDLPQNDLHL